MAAASIGPDPGPAYIRAELTSGGSTAKSTFSSDRSHGREGIDGSGARRMGVASRTANKSQSFGQCRYREERRPNETVPTAEGSASHRRKRSHLNKQDEILATGYLHMTQGLTKGLAPGPRNHVQPPSGAAQP
ncbi:hypothetical protein MAHJHV58_42950 [Mycobacterium avium subsp. hominissuis]|uniref:Uncharacterized protein n=1 Tax=Mycobacterium avium subsp. hominissuis TaxID=439334 RepID=A0AAI8SP57_MYCAV|nr:hypothetical protein JPH1_30110 [Mycobacterium avium subsp. hominissuis]BCO41985.1 hypothetical protein MINTM001_31240 [Mycobacterium paraintracellulare]BCO52452.1 hypothetical protein MINTM003_28930 [Mycobacterium paraintracellulare]